MPDKNKSGENFALKPQQQPAGLPLKPPKVVLKLPGGYSLPNITRATRT